MRFALAWAGVLNEARNSGPGTSEQSGSTRKRGWGASGLFGITRPGRWPLACDVSPLSPTGYARIEPFGAAPGAAREVGWRRRASSHDWAAHGAKHPTERRATMTGRDTNRLSPILLGCAADLVLSGGCSCVWLVVAGDSDITWTVPRSKAITNVFYHTPDHPDQRITFIYS